jgi:valyl-tRNA synthetase
MITEIHKNSLLLISPILPFSSEEAFHHSFGESMYKDKEYLLPGYADRAYGSNIEELKTYRLIYEIKTKLLSTIENMTSGESRKTRTKYDMVVIWPQKAIDVRRDLLKIGLDHLAKFLDVNSITLEQDELRKPSEISYNVRGSFKLRRCDFKLIPAKGSVTMSKKNQKTSESLN